MRDLVDIHPERPDQGFQFPGVFEISVLGRADGGLEAELRAVLAGLGLAVVDGSLRERPSREGNYVSLTIAFHSPDRASYDAVHARLRAHPAVRWTI